MRILLSYLGYAHTHAREERAKTELQNTVGRVTMPSLRKLKKLFTRNSTAHIHPRKRDDELAVCMKKIQRERIKLFHVKVRL